MYKRRFFFSLILIFNILIKFWRLGQIPPIFDSSYFHLRVMSAFLGILTPFVLYLYARKISLSIKSAVLSIFIFSFLPVAVVESRIASTVQLSSLFLLLLFPGP